MKKSMIHYDAVGNNSEAHNSRSVKLNYVRNDLSYLNEKWIDNESTISKKIVEIKDYCKKVSGRALQKNAIPIREAVVLLNDEHTMVDLHNLAHELKVQLGINTWQIYLHRDEGHYDKLTNEWKPNIHAHLVSDFQSSITGKMLGLNKSQMSLMQDIAASCLKMERGNEKGKTRLSAIEFKIKKREEEVLELENKIELYQNNTEIENFENLLVTEKSFFGTAKIDNDATLFNHQNLILELENLRKKAKIDIDKLTAINANLLQEKSELINQNKIAKNQNFKLLTNNIIYENSKQELSSKLFLSLLKEANNFGFKHPDFTQLELPKQKEMLSIFLKEFISVNGLNKSFYGDISPKLNQISSEILKGALMALQRKVNLKIKRKL